MRYLIVILFFFTSCSKNEPICKVFKGKDYSTVKCWDSEKDFINYFKNCSELIQNNAIAINAFNIDTLDICLLSCERCQ